MEEFKLLDIVAILALLVASLSALYSRWTYSETKKSNNIALHNKKLEIYKSFNTLRFTMSEKGCSVTHIDIVQFSEASRHSEFYFNQVVSKKIKEYYEVCFEISDLSRKLSRKHIAEEKRELYYKEQDVFFEKEFKLAEELDEKLKKDMVAI